MVMAGENEQQGQQDQQQQQNIDQQDLDLVDDRLEDEGKDEAALWSEFDAEESGQKAATDDGAGDGGGDDAAAAGSDDGAAAAGDDDGGTGSDDDSAATQQSGSAQDPDGKSDDGSKGPPSDDGRAQADEVWANATPEQRAAYDAAQTELKRLQHAERSNRGRISALQRQIGELSGGQRPSQQQADPSKGSAEQQGQGDGAGSDQGSRDQNLLKSEDWTKFRDEYPEVAAPLENLIGGLEAQVTRQQKELAAIGADRRESALAEQAGILAEEHSDWQEVVADDGFVEWVEAQPRHIREAAIRNAEDIVDAEEAADVVGRFKAYRAEQQGGGNAQQPNAPDPQGGQGNGNQQARRQRQLESASTTRSRGPGVATGIPEDGDPERIWKQFDEMDRRQAGGGT